MTVADSDSLDFAPAGCRKRHQLHPIKVVALTGDLSDELRQELESGGVDGFLTKPVDLDLLHSEVDRLMAD